MKRPLNYYETYKKFFFVLLFGILIIKVSNAQTAKVICDFGSEGFNTFSDISSFNHYPAYNQVSDILPKAIESGLSGIRQDFYIEKIIPKSLCNSVQDYLNNVNGIQNPANWDFTETDLIINDAYSRGLSIMALTTYCPEWLSYNQTGTTEEKQFGVPSNWTVYEDIIKKVVQRYQSKVTSIELYNEITYFLNLIGSPYTDKKAAITDMYYHAAKAIRTVNTTIPLGGLATAYATDYNELAYLLNDSRITPASNYFNFISFHDYNGTNNVRGVWEFRRIAAAKGFGNLPVYVNEWAASYGTDERHYTYKAIAYVGRTLIDCLQVNAGSFYYQFTDSWNVLPHYYFTWDWSWMVGTLNPQAKTFRALKNAKALAAGVNVKPTYFSNFTNAIGLKNTDNKPVILLDNETDGNKTVDVIFRNVNMNTGGTLKMYLASESSDGSTASNISYTSGTNEVRATITLPRYSFAALVIDNYSIPTITNYALTASVTVSGSHSADEVGTMANDNNLETKWCSNNSSKWIQFDLGSVKTVGSAIIHHGASREKFYGGYNTIDFTLQASSNGTDWLTVANVTGNTSDITIHNLNVSMRYFKMNITNGGSDNVARIFEIELLSGTGTPTIYYKIQNRWQSTYMNNETNNGKDDIGTLGNANWWSAQWEIEDTGDGYVRFINRSTNKLLHMENNSGYVQATAGDPAWWSAQWLVEDAGWGGYVRIKNRWSGQYMHNENNYSYVQVGNLGDPDWNSAQWLLHQQSTSTIAAIKTGLRELSEPKLNVFPNPSSNGMFNIDLKEYNMDEKICISITDMNGKIVFQTQVFSGKIEIINTALPEGIYFLKAISSLESVVRKIMVQ